MKFNWNQQERKREEEKLREVKEEPRDKQRDERRGMVEIRIIIIIIRGGKKEQLYHPRNVCIELMRLLAWLKTFKAVAQRLRTKGIKSGPLATFLTGGSFAPLPKLEIQFRPEILSTHFQLIFEYYLSL